MSEQSVSQRSPQQDQTYVVSLAVLAKDYDGSLPLEFWAWKDIATVTVPPRTKRSVVIKRALAEAGIVPRDGEQPKVRALDVDSAEVHEPKAHQPAPEWRI